MTFPPRSGTEPASMPTPPITLHSLLSGGGPALRVVEVIQGSVRPCRTWPDLDPSNVSYWRDFTFANLRAVFGDILDQTPASEPGSSSSTPRAYSIRSVSDVKSMAKGHLDALLRGPIADGAAVLGQRMRRVFPAISLELISRPAPPRPPLSFSFDDLRRTWLVLGAARKSATWESDSLHDENVKSSDLYPLRQLASYAAAGRTPYTFIVTDQELVVVRFFLVEDNPSRLGAEWKAIRWAETGDNVLTANLAIWCLVMMALNEDHWKIELRSRTPPISFWKPRGVRMVHGSTSSDLQHMKGTFVMEVVDQRQLVNPSFASSHT